jgi:hypothetical protein
MDNLDSTFDYTEVDSMHHLDTTKINFTFQGKTIAAFNYPCNG